MKVARLFQNLSNGVSHCDKCDSNRSGISRGRKDSVFGASCDPELAKAYLGLSIGIRDSNTTWNLLFSPELASSKEGNKTPCSAQVYRS